MGSDQEISLFFCTLSLKQGTGGISVAQHTVNGLCFLLNNLGGEMTDMGSWEGEQKESISQRTKYNSLIYCQAVLTVKWRTFE